MKKLNFLISLTTNENDYQIEQAAAAEEAARKLGADVQIVYADNDAINQSQRLLKAIQSPGVRPDAIAFEPVGSTGLPQVARAAAAAGIGWVILNREADSIAQLRSAHRVPVFSITSDHREIGRIQGRQVVALIPGGGSVLYIQVHTRSSGQRCGSAPGRGDVEDQARERPGQNAPGSMDGGECAPGGGWLAALVDLACFADGRDHRPG